MKHRCLKIIVAESHPIMREGIRSLLLRQADMELIAEVASGPAAVELAHSLKPDIIVLDISLADPHAEDTTRKILAANPQAKIIIMSLHSEYQYAQRFFQAGASGYLIKECVYEELAQAIRVVAGNERFLSPAAARAGYPTDGCTEFPESAAAVADKLSILEEGPGFRVIDPDEIE